MEYLLKASVVIAIFYLCFFVLLKKETFFQHNRWFLLMGLLIALVFPLIVIPVYIPIEPIAFQETVFAQNMASNFVIATPKPSFNWLNLLPILYSIGVAVFFIQFIFQFGSLASLLLKNPKAKDGIYTYVIVKSKISPFSFFKWIVYNPESYKGDELQLILTHEKVHAKQMHTIDLIFTQLACVVFWFNPLIWLYRKEVRQNLEYIADFETQTQSETKKEYQHLLLKTGVANHDISLRTNFYNSSIKKRIFMLNKSRSNRKNKLKYLLMLPLLAGLLISMNTEDVYIESETIKKIDENKIEDKDKERLNKSITFESIKVKFTNKMSDESLDEKKAWLKSKNVIMTIKHLKRNSKNEISEINIDFKTKNGSANYNVKEQNGIKPFYFKMEDDGSFSVGTFQKEEQIKETIMVHGLKEAIANGKSNDTLYFKIDSSEVRRLSKEKNDVYYEGGKTIKLINSEEVIIHQPEKAYKNITYQSSKNPKPLIIVDGKEVSSDSLKKIDSNNIESVTVLKDEKAIETYGEKGKNGVIVLKTKDENTWTEKLEVEENNSWTTKSELQSVTFIDDEDASKNASIAYISMNSSDEILDTHKANLKKIGITVKYSKLKRNKANEITSIKISLDDNNGSKSSANWKSNKGIPNIEFGKSEGSLFARTKVQ